MNHRLTTTGIYGGSYNPIHTGHTALGQWLVEHGYVDELWFLVSPQNPLKPASGLLDDQARLHLARLAVKADTEDEVQQGAKCSRLHVSDFEFHLPRPSYMVHTLAALRETYTDREFVLVIGADNWQRFPRWYQSDEILRHHRIIIYPRPGYAMDASTFPRPDATTGLPSITVADTPLHDISSSQIREAIAHDPTYDGWGLDARVWEEIKARNYYVQ